MARKRAFDKDKALDFAMEIFGKKVMLRHLSVI